MEIKFNGKRALVTGATKGIGRDIAIQLHKCGAQVIAVGRAKPDLDSLKKEYPQIETLQLDVSASWDQTEAILSKVGPIDLLVNNAGLGMVQSIPDTDEATVDRIINTNLKAVINITKLVVKNLIARKVPGAIVTISSQASLAGLPDHTVYAASKGAVDGYTRAAALELGKHNIRINNVNPTVIKTDMSVEFWSEPSREKWMLERIPLKRFGEVREVTDAVLYLLSDKASMINGTCLPIDGGFVAC